MARVTVEDCVAVIPNRYELVLLAAQRARDIAAGMPLTVDRDNDKNAVVALREIAEQTIDLEELRRHIVKGVNRHSDLNLEDDALMALTQEEFVNVEQTEEPEGQITEIAFEDAKPEAEEAAEDVLAAAVEEMSAEEGADASVEEVTEETAATA